MSPILGIWASQNYSRYSITGAYDSIATVSVGSGGSSSIDFTSIPSTYTHLQIRAIYRTSGAGFNPFYRFNSDTNTNYSRHLMYADGSAVYSEGFANSSAIVGTVVTSASSTFNATVVDILDYKDTNKYKTLRLLDGFDANGSGYISLGSGNWRSTSAITSITISNGTFAQYSHFALYGIKGA